ncbi:hypothetical protein DUHN55_35170 [Helicobacter pylori]
MLKRAAAAAALSLVPIAVTAVPAQAAYSCGVTVPSKVSITSEYRTITGKYSRGCLLYAEDAVWSVVHPTQGPWDAFWFSGASSESLDWYSWEPLGTYTVRPEGAYDYNYNDMTQNTTKMTVRLGARQTISTSRAGSYVTVKGTATRFSPNSYPSGFRAWSGTKVTLRQKTCSSCSWKWVKSGTTDRYGRVTLKAYASSARYWQLATADSSTTWGRASSSAKR